jgi:hypothetical protein
MKPYLGSSSLGGLVNTEIPPDLKNHSPLQWFCETLAQAVIRRPGSIV